MSDTSLEHDRGTNVSHDSLRSYVDRLFNIEREFADVKAEYNDTKKDLRVEIKNREDETGISVKRVEGLVKIRLNEQKARDAAEEIEADLFLYEQVYGFAPSDGGDEEDDPLG